MNKKSVELKDEITQLKDENIQLQAVNRMLKNIISGLNEHIDRTNAILRENPSLLKAFKQEKRKFMQKYGSENKNAS